MDIDRSQTVVAGLVAMLLLPGVLCAGPVAAPPAVITVFEQGGDANYHIPSLVVANDGTVLAFCEERWKAAGDNVAECHIVLRRSRDQGRTWLPMVTLHRKEGGKFHMGSACVDRATGTVLLMCGGGWLKSDDSGATWTDWKPRTVAPADGMGGSTHGSGPGVTLQYGDAKGRLLWPARAVDKSNGYSDGSIPDRQAKCYSTALYSDDHGKTIQRANVFLRGTGEACLVERMDGTVYFNARAYFDDHRRRTALSRDAGRSFGDEGIDPSITEISQGVCAGMVRYPAKLIGGADLVLFSNPDTQSRVRCHGVLRGSRDGGRTWAYAKQLNSASDWFDYSSIAVAHDGTILVMAKSTATGRGLPGFAKACSMIVFRVSLEWLTDGQIDLPRRPSTRVELLPTPKQVRWPEGQPVVVARPGDGAAAACIVAGPEAGYAAEVLAARLKAPIVRQAAHGCLPIELCVDAHADFAARLACDARPEAYRLQIGPAGIKAVAAEPEGLLRAAATLLQLLSVDGGRVAAPQVEITDWPDVRYRSAADWLLNVECNRWAYDWGDGPKNYLARIERMLDFCFQYKINMVWFDGFGWNVDRFPGYAQLMSHCTRAARRRGIKLVFGGYGGGYGTSYQQSEIYRCGYFGQTFLNRRPWPDGPEYRCRGMGRVAESRRYGTCLSNAGLCAAKIEEMKRFATAVEPGVMYIHDIDAGTWAASEESWKARCDACRQRWPSDDISSPQGQVGALAEWFGRVRTALDGVTTSSGYRAAQDLTVIFVSPLYTEYYERGPSDLWQREVDYFAALGRLLGPRRNVEIGLREQFYRPGGGMKIAHLRSAMDRAGNGLAIHVIAFGGGDHYLSDDLANVSGAMTPFYHGAESICLSNGGVHEEPIQVLNAEFLWNGRAAGYRTATSDEPSTVALFRRMCQGRCRPAEIFGPGELFQRICQRLWGPAAGREMYLAYMAPGESGDGPVSRVWWSVTSCLARLRAKPAAKATDWSAEHSRWLRRLEHTRLALAHARQAARLCDHEQVRWFAQSLDVGSRFAEALVDALQLRIHDDPPVRVHLAQTLRDLEACIPTVSRLEKTDLIGGDPGCWLESIANLRELGSAPRGAGR
jgi:sialidase-1